MRRQCYESNLKADMSGERQLFCDLGDQTGIVSVTSGGEIDSYRNISETGAYAGQVHDLALVLDLQPTSPNSLCQYHVAQGLFFLFNHNNHH